MMAFEYKVTDPSGNRVAECKTAEAAAILVGVYGTPAKVFFKRRVVWLEGYEDDYASNSYDLAADTMRARVNSRGNAAKLPDHNTPTEQRPVWQERYRMDTGDVGRR